MLFFNFYSSMQSFNQQSTTRRVEAITERQVDFMPCFYGLLAYKELKSEWEVYLIF